MLFLVGFFWDSTAPTEFAPLGLHGGTSVDKAGPDLRPIPFGPSWRSVRTLLRGLDSELLVLNMPGYVCYLSCIYFSDVTDWSMMQTMCLIHMISNYF